MRRKRKPSEWQKIVQEFEKTQENYGTEAAIHNVIWDMAARQLKIIGVKHLITRGKV